MIIWIFLIQKFQFRKRYALRIKNSNIIFKIAHLHIKKLANYYMLRTSVTGSFLLIFATVSYGQQPQFKRYEKTAGTETKVITYHDADQKKVKEMYFISTKPDTLIHGQYRKFYQSGKTEVKAK